MDRYMQMRDGEPFEVLMDDETAKRLGLTPVERKSRTVPNKARSALNKGRSCNSAR